MPRTRDPGPRTTIATPQEIQRLAAVAPPWVRCVVVLATAMGWRAAECLRIAEDSLDRSTGLITTTVKGGKQHTLPATPGVLALFDSAPPGDRATPIATRYREDRFPLTLHSLHRAWRKLVKKAGVNPALNIHDLRRTAAVTLYELTKDLRVVEQLLGHQNLSTTGRYLEHRDPAKLGPLLAAMWTPKGPVQ